MTLKTIALHGSPYIGVFCAASDRYALVPHFIDQKENKRIGETLNVDVIPTSIGNSFLNGVLSRGLGNKFCVASDIQDNEIDHLKSNGIHIHVLKEISAVGNLLCMQKNAGIISPTISLDEKKDLEEFFGIPLHAMLIGKSELAGSSLVATEKGFLANPRASVEQLEMLEKLFRVAGMTTTANYGDPYVGNSVLANAFGTMVGERTSGPELARIDEGLHPGLHGKGV